VSVLDLDIEHFRDTGEEIVRRYGSFERMSPGNFTFESSVGTLFVTMSEVYEPGGIDWTLIIMIPRSDWYSKVDTANRMALVVGVLFLLLSGIAASFAASCITRPLQNMANTMQRITTSYDPALEMKLSDRTTFPHSRCSHLKEIASLQLSFNRLQHTLSSFLKYVPVDVVRLLLQHNAEAVLGVETCDVTLFFSDIVNFTSMSEQMDPQQLIRVVSRYLGEAAEIILSSDGTLADIIGDEVFAFWNAPKSVPNHPLVACHAALLQQRLVKDINRCFSGQDLPDFSVRMGIHTGSALCGNIGSTRRMKFTAIGDAVNLASRLESLNKRYGTKILITTDVYNCVREELLCRAVDVVIVKGRRAPTLIYELLGPKRDATVEQKLVCKHAACALELFKQRNFEGCLKRLNQMEHLIKDDKAVLFLRQKCQRYILAPPPENWIGAEEETEK
jgi:adenylate cyclase